MAVYCVTEECTGNFHSHQFEEHWWEWKGLKNESWKWLNMNNSHRCWIGMYFWVLSYFKLLLCGFGEMFWFTVVLKGESSSNSQFFSRILFYSNLYEFSSVWWGETSTSHWCFHTVPCSYAEDLVDLRFVLPAVTTQINHRFSKLKCHVSNVLLLFLSNLFYWI